MFAPEGRQSLQYKKIIKFAQRIHNNRALKIKVLWRDDDPFLKFSKTIMQQILIQMSCPRSQ